jgi:GNAT superfamily N-acetyltransferase
MPRRRKAARPEFSLSPEAGERLKVRLATAADRSHVSRLLAAALFDDAAITYIFPDPKTRRARLPRFFAILFDSDGKAGPRIVTAGGEAATLWRRPGLAQVGWLEMLAEAGPLLRALGTALPRALRVGDAIDAHMPSGDFHYLHIAGCDPRHHGRGHGSQAIAAGLALAGDAPAYLETPNPLTLPLYARHGFEVTGEWQVPKGGPRFWSMLRPANFTA